MNRQPVARPHPVRRAAGVLQRVTSTSLGPYQTAVVRIGFSATWMFFLLREWPHRRELYGPDGPWGWHMASRLIGQNGAFSGLMWSSSGVWFEIVYTLAVVSSALLLLGWRTRTMSVVYMFGVLSLLNRNVFVGDGGDNVIHLMSIYLVATRCGQVWSLDARRAARWAAGPGRDKSGAAEGVGALPRRRDRTGPVLWVVAGVLLAVGAVTDRVHVETPLVVVFWGTWGAQAVWWLVNRRAPTSQLRALLDVLANLLHNAGLAVIMAEVCLVYSTAGWYKIQGSRWEDGTALYYPLHLDYFTPWPALSGILAASGVIVMVLSYATVMMQVAFPFALFNRRVKNVLLVAMMAEHLGIAVLLGLPFFSMAMIAADAVFLPTNFLRWLRRRLGDGARRLIHPGRVALPGQRRPPDRQRRTLVG